MHKQQKKIRVMIPHDKANQLYKHTSESITQVLNRLLDKELQRYDVINATK